MSFPIGTVLFLLVSYFIAWHFNNASMLHPRARHAREARRIPVLPPYPDHNEPKTDSKISGSDSDARKQDDASKPSSDGDSNDNGNGKPEYLASVADVSRVRDILRRSWSSSSQDPGKDVVLPDELIDMILDEAEYWPSVVTNLRTTPFVISTDGDRECLRTPPLCYDVDAAEDDAPRILLHRGIHPCRKIVFNISSHDQGWGGDRQHQGTFKGSWTWFSAYISPHKRENGSTHSDSKTSDSESDKRSVSSHPRPFLPEPGKLQCNRTATFSSSDHHIVWHYRDHIQPDSDEAARIEQETGRGRATLDGSEVRGMKVGDEVSVWLRARFAGWRNHVDGLSVRVFWAA